MCSFNTESLYRSDRKTPSSRWIKNILAKSGVDTHIYSAHSTRHAATSAASRKGLSVDLIRRSAGWSQSSETFANSTTDR